MTEEGGKLKHGTGQAILCILKVLNYTSKLTQTDRCSTVLGLLALRQSTCNTPNSHFTPPHVQVS